MILKIPKNITFSKFYKKLNGKIPIIGVGGINSGKSAYEKISAGASLLQLYTGLVYKGPSVAKEIKKELIKILKNKITYFHVVSWFANTYSYS